MAESNEHIVEVLCAMSFDPKSNEWDSTYFGKFDDKIKELGYTVKEEQKELEIRFDTSKPGTEMKEGKIKMIFRNPMQATAIILSSHFISFHKLKPYNNWDDLMKAVVEPGLKAYKAIGLGNALTEVQCLYLNKHELRADQSIATLFNFLPTIEEGREANILFQAKYDLPNDVSVQLKLNTVAREEGVRDLFFECSTFAKALDNNYLTLSQKAHDQANAVYRRIINYKKDAISK